MLVCMLTFPSFFHSGTTQKKVLDASEGISRPVCTIHMYFQYIIYAIIRSVASLPPAQQNGAQILVVPISIIPLVCRRCRLEEVPLTLMTKYQQWLVMCVMMQQIRHGTYEGKHTDTLTSYTDNITTLFCTKSTLFFTVHIGAYAYRHFTKYNAHTDTLKLTQTSHTTALHYTKHAQMHTYYTLNTWMYNLFHRCVVSYQDQNFKKPYIIPLGSGSGNADEVQSLLTTDIVAYALYRVVSDCYYFFVCITK